MVKSQTMPLKGKGFAILGVVVKAACVPSDDIHRLDDQIGFKDSPRPAVFAQ
jgi:hypothetical protein